MLFNKSKATSFSRKSVSFRYNVWKNLQLRAMERIYLDTEEDTEGYRVDIKGYGAE